MVFVKFLRYFKVIFEEGKTMWMIRKKQCTWTKLWSWFGGGWGGYKRYKWKKCQKRVENLCISISHDHAKILHSHAKWTKTYFFYCNSKGNLKADFAWPCEIFAQSCETLQQNENAANGLSTSHHHASSCQNVFSPDSLMKKPPEDLLDDAKCPLDLGL